MKMLVYAEETTMGFFLVLAKRLKKEGILMEALAPSPRAHSIMSNAGFYGSIFPLYDTKICEESELDLGLISSYERKYGNPSFWNTIYGDRHHIIYSSKEFSHSHYLSLIQSYVPLLEKILEKTRPNLIFMVHIDRFISYLLYLIAKQKGIRTLFLMPTRVEDRYSFMYSPRVGCERILDGFEKLRISGEKSPCRKQAEGFLTRFRTERVVPEYLNVTNKIGNKQGNLLHLASKVSGAFTKTLQSPAMLPDYMAMAKYESKRIILKERAKHGLFEKEIAGEEYALFPLHVEPEIATALMAPMYINQLFLIENIAKSLPITYKLYVKEHPAQITHGRPRHLDYYKRLKKIPNVRLISPYSDTNKLIKNAKLVMVITGTAGFEAALLRKPVITFGEVFFNALSSVNYCAEINKLPNLVLSSIENQTFSDDELIDMLSSIYEHSFSLDTAHFIKYQASPPANFEAEGHFDGLYSAVLDEFKFAGTHSP